MSTALILLSAMVSNDVPFCAITSGDTDLATIGAACTVNVATLLGVPGVGKPVYDAPLVWLLLVPAILLVTEMVMVQPVVGTLPAVTAKFVTPTPALLTTPRQVPPTVADDIVIPPGNASVNAKPVIAAPVGLAMEKVIVDTPPLAMVVGANALAMPSRATLSMALAVRPVPPLVEVIAVVVLV